MGKFIAFIAKPTLSDCAMTSRFSMIYSLSISYRLFTRLSIFTPDLPNQYIFNDI